jgi:tyrosine-protein kinase Etk/Wzc
MNDTVSKQSLNGGQVAPQDDDTIDLASILDLVIDNRWLIAAVALVITLLGASYAFIATPIYQADLLIQVEDTPDSSHNILGDLAGAFEIKSAATAEIEIIKSRMVVTRAIDNINLDLVVKPSYFPVVGHWVARRNGGLSQPGFFGAGGFVWGSEAADIGVFDIPIELEGEEFVLTAQPGGRYTLKQDDVNFSVSGQVGQTLRAATAQGPVEVRIDRLYAKPGAQFTVVRQKKLDTVEDLQNSLTISEKGKQSGIIGVALEGPDPAKTANIINEIGKEYVRQNVERKAAEAEKSLEFLDKQLPKMKASLEDAEAKYTALRNNKGTIDLGEEAKSILQQSVLSETTLLGLKQRRDELLTRYQEANPLVQAVDQQIRTLQGEIASVNQRIRVMPSVEQDVLRLTRDVKVNTELYTSLLNSAQQLRLLKASKVGNARVLDQAVSPLHPIRPKRALIIFMSAVIGLMVGSLCAFARKSLFGGIEDPHEIEQMLGLSVSAAIPFSEKQEILYADVKAKAKKVSVLAQQDPRDGAIESLRSFRTSLQFSMLGAKNNIILISGATPGVGKSFVSVNLAAVLASTGKKILLIDADLRKGYLHQYFGLERQNGLSELIAGQTALELAIQRSVVSNVDFIKTGVLPPQPAELLTHQNFAQLLATVSEQYDIVLMDTGPVLAVSDPLVIAPLVGCVFSIVRGGVTTMGEIEESVSRFNKAGSAVTGVIFNGLKQHIGRYGYGSKYGKYRYTSYEY